MTGASVPPSPMGEPPKRWLVMLRYEDVFGRSPTRDNLSEFIRKLPCAAVVVKCTAIAFLSWRFGPEEKKHQAGLLANLLQSVPTYAKTIETLLADKSMPRVLFTAETLLAMARIAIVEGSDGDPKLTEKSWADNFLRAALAVNGFNSDELLPKEMRHSAQDLIASELRSALARVDNPHIVYGRTEAFFAWAGGAAKAHPDYIDLDADLKSISGIDHEEYAGSAYALWARTAQAKTLDEMLALGVAFDKDKWLANVKDSRAPRAWLQAASVEIETIRKEWKDEPSLSYAGAGLLYRYPVLIVDEGLRIAPSPALLANAMGDGIYFTLLNNYDEERKGKLSRFYGAFFEDYVASVFERGYAPRGAFFRRGVEYKKGVLSSDAFISDNGDVFFIEVVAKRMNLVRSILRLDAAQIQKDLEQGVLKKMRQLHRNVADFRSGALFPNVKRVKGQRVFPILVSPKAFPRIYVIANIVKEAQEKDGLLKDAEPIEFLDVQEIEQLESEFIAGISLGDLLHRKNSSTPQKRFMTLNNYLIDEEPKTATRGNLALKRGNAAARKLVDGIVTSWLGTTPGKAAE